MKDKDAATERPLSGIHMVLSLAAMLAIASVLYLAYGGVRQLMSSAACAPGRPEMSLRAFALGAFGTSCIERPSS